MGEIDTSKYRFWQLTFGFGTSFEFVCFFFLSLKRPWVLATYQKWAYVFQTIKFFSSHKHTSCCTIFLPVSWHLYPHFGHPCSCILWLDTLPVGAPSEVLKFIVPSVHAQSIYAFVIFLRILLPPDVLPWLWYFPYVVNTHQLLSLTIVGEELPLVHFFFKYLFKYFSSYSFLMELTKITWGFSHW